ncbi:MAG: alpha/beta fold hydrolase [Anaerolineae bacterium]
MTINYSPPGWLDQAEYPFSPHWFRTDAGQMHYVDEGKGPSLIMVHGTPDWSFGFRNLIKGLTPGYRCIAPDHLGFGLSDKPRGWSYSPREQAANLSHLIESLDLQDITLLVHDFGGPIGLAYAIDHPERVRSLVLMNTWMWSLRGDPHFEQAARLFGSPLGKLLYLQFGFSARVIMPMAYGDKSKLPTHIHRQYLEPLATPDDRAGTWAYARALVGASDWYDSLWQRREQIKDKPALILWGVKDPAFREQELSRLESMFSRYRTVRLATTGHFVQEEQPEQACTEIINLLK